MSGILPWQIISPVPVQTKLIGTTLILVLFPLLCVTYLSQYRFGMALKSAAEEDLEHLVGNIYSRCKVQYEMAPKWVSLACEPVKIKNGEVGGAFSASTKEGQVFLNLIANAKDAMDLVTGRKDLTISSKLVSNETTSVVVVIKDTGAGIPPESLDKIFEPFFSTKL